MHEQESQRYTAAKKITVLGAVVNVLLGVLKILFGWIGHSAALVADGVHSFSDLITDAMVLVASKWGSARADADHPYGHERIETIVAVALAQILLVTGLLIIADAIYELAAHKKYIVPDKFVLLIAGISILANELLYQFTKKVANKIESSLLMINAWHHRSDAFSSLVVLVGVTGSLLGFHYSDALAAIVVGLMICKMSWRMGLSGVKELIDTSINDEDLANIKNIICQTPGVTSLHHLRARTMGPKIIVDVHVLVNPTISVSEGHYIGEQVHFTLMEKISAITDVTVHIDPEDDEKEQVSLSLPTRPQIEKKLKECCRNIKESEYILSIGLHYLAGKVQVSICLPMKYYTQTLEDSFTKCVETIDYIDLITVLYQ